MKQLITILSLLFALSLQAQYQSKVWCPDNGLPTIATPMSVW